MSIVISELLGSSSMHEVGDNKNPILLLFLCHKQKLQKSNIIDFNENQRDKFKLLNKSCILTI